MTKWMKMNRPAYPFLFLPFIIALFTGLSLICILSTDPQRHHQCFVFGRGSLFLEPRVHIFSSRPLPLQEAHEQTYFVRRSHPWGWASGQHSQPGQAGFNPSSGYAKDSIQGTPPLVYLEVALPSDTILRIIRSTVDSMSDYVSRAWLVIVLSAPKTTLKFQVVHCLSQHRGSSSARRYAK